MGYFGMRASFAEVADAISSTIPVTCRAVPY
jgi:hypothetical protein